MSLYSAGVEYGIHCLLFLVGNRGETREASVRDLAELQGVPLDYLAKIFTRLAKAKLVSATEGVRGGFKLARPADEISLLDIVNAIDGQKLIFDCKEIRGRCALFEGNTPEWALDGHCSVHGAMMVAQKRMEEALAQQTILDLARKVGRKAPAEFSEQVDTWITDRRDRKSASPQGIPLTDISN
ncbi:MULTISPECIES: RrF2 family transcriptional regulator [unclassified Pseudomonas]|uniref:RrF2 family transcriptional regulator n=1 Tax=unclassified Pseudomonas TaxID=196821 RepID=UPI000F088DBB|nr:MULTISPECIES: Rrf2 family transcriptional regulator [unclassified Pseudomonas]MCA4960498.1 Rrf2 family transcriptional regulator [Pseudomonas sp. Y24-6]MCH4878268.1 Rrf2 family transcriptional regulator [Pseudomonas sp. TMW22090]